MMADLPVNPWTADAGPPPSFTPPAANLDDGSLQRLQALEEELRAQTGRNIVVVAYDNGPRPRFS
ncbi:MAG: hypothetical protein IRZ10_06460 [Thermoflavifilum sp.]|nr:hypothetical protein [Thermoflavifilum sp.]MCL6514048.1 hypothetical protein [Alicyclobacillus sp.]